MASISDPLVKANDVTLIPVLDLPESMRNQFEYEAGDYAIARDQSRANGKIINADTAALINAFSQPVSIAEAVIRFSAERQVDPYETLEQAFPLIQQFVNSRILVLESQNDVAAESQPLQYGDTIGRFTITHLVQQLEDTAIYQATDDDGHVVAIKQQAEHTSAAVTRLLQHEATILNALDGVTTPELMAIDVADDRAFLAMAWCDGVDALTAAGELRDDRPQLLHLLRSVVAAYADIHRQGIVHGDVHPGNILIDGNGTDALDRLRSGAQNQRRRSATCCLSRWCRLLL
ncbi:MAG: AarF/UbiB family protein [Anaerolineae bacterium]|nr:AarF/UbiB family protein [Anaerolineae bacterium]